ncbi:MAG: prephenate dehydrogenase [Actinomycetota bacterium]|nr:prephenate dehydrogenase [Actinomycetota bacterium]
MLRHVRIVGSGLIGTSIALALTAKGVGVEMVDRQLWAQNLASDLTGGLSASSPEIVILALPSDAIPQVIEAEYALNPHSIFMDVSSVKTEPILHIASSSLPLADFVATHPMAGREIGGAQSARADLFQSRSWIVTPTQANSPEAIALVSQLIELVGAHIVILSSDEHDRAVAAISHLPQIVATLLAQSLNELPPQWLSLSGTGLGDTTRIAASDPELWSGIIYSNRSKITAPLRRLHEDLGALIENLEDKQAIATFIDAGRAGRARIPGKHGGAARKYTHLPIVIDDKPGQLAAIFNECAAINVNVEDLGIEHSPGQLSALITLALSASDATLLSAHLSSLGWNVHPVLQ